MKQGALIAHSALLTVALIYGANYLIAKGLMPGLIGPSGFIVLRAIGAVVLFWAVYATRFERIRRDDLLRLALCGLFGVTSNQLMFFNGLSMTSPVNASIIMTSNPILVLVVSSVLLKTAITARKVLGIALGAAGALILLYLSAGSFNTHISWQGDLLILGNAISYGIYLVLVKPLMMKYRPTTVIAWVFLFGALFVLPIGWSQVQAIDFSSFTPSNYWAVAYVIIGTTFLAYLLNSFALTRVMPTVVSMYIYLQPLFAGLFAYVYARYGGEDFTGDLTLGRLLCAALIFTGVYLVSSARS
jgi:drug/metabolite transporter (DMT)-like permease